MARFDLVLVDGPNLFGSLATYLLRHSPANADAVKGYFLTWFDLDRFVLATQGGEQYGSPTLGIVAVHSRRALGPKEARLDERDVDSFWSKQAGNPNTSCLEVNVPGDQQESYPFRCEKCAHENLAKTRGEKGVDNAMTVYMFESFDRWESLCIFSRDVDFSPAIWALRRRGKRVFVAAHPEDATTGLGRASQSLFQLAFTWLERDFATYRLCRPGGVFDGIVADLSAALNPSEFGVLVAPDELLLVATKAMPARFSERVVLGALANGCKELPLRPFEEPNNFFGVAVRVTSLRPIEYDGLAAKPAWLGHLRENTTQIETAEPTLESMGRWKPEDAT